jgi:hypothetical protein
MAGPAGSGKWRAFLFDHVTHSRLVGMACLETISSIQRGNATVREEVDEGPGTRRPAEPSINGVKNLFAQAASLVFRQHGDVRHLKDGAAISNDATHAHRPALMFDNNGKQCVGKRNPDNLLTPGRETSSRAKRAVLCDSGIAHRDLILRHHSTLSANFRDARDGHFLVVAVISIRGASI